MKSFLDEKWKEYRHLSRVRAVRDASSVRAHIELIYEEIAAINAELSARRERRNRKPDHR